jgi:tripartite ATP-independent transporter DctM subunit
VISEGMRPIMVVQQMYQGLDSFTLLAVPFFLLAGQLMNTGLVTDRLIRLAQAMVGHIRGGLSYVNVVVSMIFAGMSGSSTADTAGVGSVMIPAMVKEGFDKRFSIAITAASSTMGVIIPPSIIMIIYGAMGGVSIGGLFLAGAVPGLMVGLAQMGYAYWYATRHNMLGQPFAGFGELGLSFVAAFLPLLVPVILVGGVVSGIFTATESGMVATVYALLLILVIYRSIRIWQLPEVLREAVVLYSQPLLAVASATVFGWLLAYFEAPQAIGGLATDFTDSPVLIVIFVAFVFLVVGTFMDAVPAIIIFMPIVSHLVEVAGVHPLHMGIIVTMTLALGLVTPPYGLCLLLACAIGRERVSKVMPVMFGFYGLFMIVLMIVILIPDIPLWLPRLIMPQFVR